MTGIHFFSTGTYQKMYIPESVETWFSAYRYAWGQSNDLRSPTASWTYTENYTIHHLWSIEALTEWLRKSTLELTGNVMTYILPSTVTIGGSYDSARTNWRQSTESFRMMMIFKLSVGGDELTDLSFIWNSETITPVGWQYFYLSIITRNLEMLNPSCNARYHPVCAESHCTPGPWSWWAQLSLGCFSLLV